MSPTAAILIEMHDEYRLLCELRIAPWAIAMLQQKMTDYAQRIFDR